MLEIMDMPAHRGRNAGDFGHAVMRSDEITPPCRYRKELAGFHVCRAASGVAVVTATDCRRCRVPEALDRTGCMMLRASVTLVPELTVEWCCGATEDAVDPDSPNDCSECVRNPAR
ncbi:MAG: hypothetical protein ACOX9R_00615 [Armatimonadota bacterium]